MTAIEARFKHRRLGKPWRYSEEVLRETPMRCAEFYGRPPSIAEFNWWRRREFALAEARGAESEVQLPTRGAYKRRCGGWEQTLLHCGFTPQEVDRRHDQRTEFNSRETDNALPDGLPIAKLANPTGDLPLTKAQARRVVAAYRRLPRRTRYVLTARLGLGGVSPQHMKTVAKPLTPHLSRIGQLQQLAIEQFALEAAGDRRGRPDPATLQDAVIGTLRRLAITLDVTDRPST